MLGECESWEDFLKADSFDLENLSRRSLRAGQHDVKNKLSDELNNFCKRNFKGMSIQILSEIYEEIKQYRGLEVPLPEFEEKYAPIRYEVLKGNPNYLTVSISLWGLKFKYPEDELTKDIITGLNIVTKSDQTLNQFESLPHDQLVKNIKEIRLHITRKKYAVRSLIIC